MVETCLTSAFHANPCGPVPLIHARKYDCLDTGSNENALAVLARSAIARTVSFAYSRTEPIMKQALS
jgi:hypothetical protein